MPSCGYCKLAKKFFRENNISVEEKDVESNQKNLKEMITKTGQTGVPVIEVDGDIIIGFDESRLRNKIRI